MGFDLGGVVFFDQQVWCSGVWVEFGQCEQGLVVVQLLQLGCVVGELVGMGDVFGFGGQQQWCLCIGGDVDGQGCDFGIGFVGVGVVLFGYCCVVGKDLCVGFQWYVVFVYVQYQQVFVVG